MTGKGEQQGCRVEKDIRKERLMQCMSDGLKGWMTEGTKDVRKDGRKDGRNDGRNDGKKGRTA